MTEENKNLEENIKRHIDVVFENVRSDFKIFGEQLSGVETKVGSLETKVDSLETKVDLLAEDMDYVKSEIVEIKDRFKETDEALEKKANKETVFEHGKRIGKLEGAAFAKVA